jgi:prepilin-type N-terminal cleavage/methylation domain-containing protein
LPRARGVAVPDALWTRARVALTRTAARLRGQSHGQHGYTMIEMLVGMTLTLFIAGATLTLLEAATRAEGRDQSYAQEITSTQTALARLVHDLRQARSFQQIAPNAIQFQLTTSGTTYNVRYDCTATDSLGSAYRRCARTSAVAPTAPPAYGANLGSLDIQHVANGSISTFCNIGGSAQSGSVFFISNPSFPNTDGSGLVCDEAYETIIGTQLMDPTYVQVLVRVPASGDLTNHGLTHTTALQSGAYIANLDPGA